ncbi:hypothetical protein [Bacillus sp. B15-48]|nr:hypothetical protein [Bacillus sp. B15-48]MBM4764567.1 hypothetical protein [Bacillus sp. B15-48]
MKEGEWLGFCLDYQFVIGYYTYWCAAHGVIYSSIWIMCGLHAGLF